MVFLKQSTAVNIKVGPFVDNADGYTPETGLTITQPDVQLSKVGGTFAQKSAAGTLAHDANGWYTAALSTTDTDTLGPLIVAIYEVGALPVWHEFMVLPANAYDGLVGGTGVGVRANVQGWLGTAPTTPGTAGVPNVDIARALNVAWGSGAITAAAIAADAITAAKVAADVSLEIADAVWDEATVGHAGAGSTGLALTDTLADTNELQTDDYPTSIAAVKADTAAILIDTAEIGAAGAGLTALPWNAAWDAEVESEVADGLAVYDPPTKAEMDTAHGLLATPAQVNAEVVDVLTVDTFALPGQTTPSNTPTMIEMLGNLFKSWKNKKTQTATTWSLFNNAGTIVDAQSTTSDDGVTATEGAVVTGP